MKHAKFPLLLLCVAALAGCVREKLADCTTTLNFNYKGDGDKEIFANHIKHMDLYVFDENHKLVEGFEHYHVSDAEFSAGKAKLLLPTGKRYNIVAIGNFGESELYSLHEGTIDSTKIFHRNHSAVSGGSGDIDTHPHLYLGREAVVIPQEAGSTHTIELGSSHVDMVVEVAGLSGPSSGSTRQAGTGLKLEHSNLPGWTDFNQNCICPRGDLVSHLPDGEWDAERGVWVFNYQVMRDLKGGKNTKGSFLHFYDGEVELLRDNPVDVEEFIQTHLMPNPDISGPYDANGVLLHEATIPIRIEFRGTDVDVSIPSWALRDVIPEF